MSWRVFKQHQVVGEFSDRHRQYDLDGTLVVKLNGKKVASFAPGEWDAGGPGAVCGHDGTGVESCIVCSKVDDEQT